MIQGLGYPSSALAVIEPRADYFASKAHYQALARRIAAVLSSGRFVLVTGDPPADPQSLSRALGNVQGPGHAVIDIRCGPELSGTELARAAALLRGPRAVRGALPTPEYSATAAPLFLFIDFDLLSDRQIEEVCESSLGGDQFRASGVLLAPLEFVTRLERPALRFLKERLAAHFCVQEVGDDELIPFLHNQLLAQRDRRSEARGFRRGILIGMGAFGVVAAAGGSAFLLLNPPADQVRESPASLEERRLAGEQALQPTERVAVTAMPVQAAPETETAATSAPARTPSSATTTPPLTEGESTAPVALLAPAPPPAGPRLSAAEIGALMERGDAFLSARDIASARLYYERAAEAGDGQAALQLGESFDPVMLERAGVRGITGDPAQALSWYRRARELGVAEAEHRIKNLPTRPLGGADTLSR